MNPEQLKRIIEGLLLAAGEPLSIERLQKLFEPEVLSTKELREALQSLAQDCAEKAIELKEVAGGFRFQVRTDLSPWIIKLWEERPPRYSRALMETLALIAYRQPITRSEIEDVRGVVVSTGIMKTLLEREWVRVVGYREVPGRPALFGTTKQFLDYFNLQSLDQLPTLQQLKALDLIDQEGIGTEQLKVEVVSNEDVVSE
jgi:segregation and condensation protein B